jgi:CO/xanthine dehydrogenase FAD-binding subunit
VIIAGGTDFYPARVGRPIDDDVVDITAVAELRRISEDTAGWRIPALTTWTDLIEAGLPPLFDGLIRAAREIGGVQIQNAATICGNLCNASPAADGVPGLLALDAGVELVSQTGSRRLSVADFVIGNRRTARRSDELVIALHVPRPRGAARSSFLKLGARRYLVISIAVVSAVVERDPAGAIEAVRIAVGACSEVPQRLHRLERELVARRSAHGLADAVADHHLEPLAPIDDIRGTAAYRRDAALTLVRRALAELEDPPA